MRWFGSWPLLMSATAEIGDCCEVAGAGLVMIGAVATLAVSHPYYKAKGRADRMTTTSIVLAPIGALLVLAGTVGFGPTKGVALSVAQSVTLVTVAAFVVRVAVVLRRTPPSGGQGNPKRPQLNNGEGSSQGDGAESRDLAHEHEEGQAVRAEEHDTDRPGSPETGEE